MQQTHVALLLCCLLAVPGHILATIVQVPATYSYDGCVNESGKLYKSGQIVYNVSRCEVWRCVVTGYNRAYMELTRCPITRARPGCRLVGPSLGRYPDCCPKEVCDKYYGIVKTKTYVQERPHYDAHYDAHYGNIH